MAADEVPDFLKPRLRLFLSADIVGSTALKQSRLGQSETPNRYQWFQKIQGFYYQAQYSFLKAFNDPALAPEEVCKGEQPELWKTIGDEVLFVKLITDHRQIAFTLSAWMAAIDELRKFVRKGNSNLDVKSVAWLAGFPLKNAEVAVDVGHADAEPLDGNWFVEGAKALNIVYEKGDRSGYILDFIGPSIDIGFRLASLATSRKLIISVDIAYILSISNPGKKTRDRIFAVYYDGSQILKGVLGGLRYPVFWLDASDEKSLDRFEDELMVRRTVDRDRLREYCNRFYDEHRDFVFPPFVDSASEQQIPKPEWYDPQLKEVMESFLKESKSGEADLSDGPGGRADKTAQVDEFLTLLEKYFTASSNAAKIAVERTPVAKRAGRKGKADESSNG